MDYSLCTLIVAIGLFVLNPLITFFLSMKKQNDQSSRATEQRKKLQEKLTLTDWMNLEHRIETIQVRKASDMRTFSVGYYQCHFQRVLPRDFQEGTKHVLLCHDEKHKTFASFSLNEIGSQQSNKDKLYSLQLSADTTEVHPAAESWLKNSTRKSPYLDYRFMSFTELTKLISHLEKEFAKFAPTASITTSLVVKCSPSSSEVPVIKV